MPIEPFQYHEDLFECFYAEDFDRALAMLAPDFQLFLPGYPEPLGREAAIEEAQRWRRAFSRFGSPGSRWYLQPSITSPEGLSVALNMEETLEHDGVFQVPDGAVIQPTNREVTVRSQHWLILTPADERLIDRLYVSFDPMSLMAQLGVSL